MKYSAKDNRIMLKFNFVQSYPRGMIIKEKYLRQFRDSAFECYDN